MPRRLSNRRPWGADGERRGLGRVTARTSPIASVVAWVRVVLDKAPVTPVDVGGRQLLDIVPGRTVDSAVGWFGAQPTEWRENIRWAVLDMSRPYQVAYDRILPHAYQVADPFHVVRLANRCVDLVRRRVQNETLGHPGTQKADPLYRIRRGCWSWRLNVSTTMVSNVSGGFFGLVTHTEKSGTPGPPKRPMRDIYHIRRSATGRGVHPAAVGVCSKTGHSRRR